ncbi:MAG TPA: helix-turn-helix domain-containing protein, partial [Candidatus Competibacteraceae bacterium]|nr:helix-turn-helix domain-containing protein [Candidatus Competibacteraceae bacterium]
MHYEPPHNDESLSSATVGPGALLRQARLARGWEPQEVASRLSVRPELVQAIENDDFSALGAPVFAKGFVQRYARLVGVPEQEALERLRRSVRSEPPPLRVTHHVKPQAKSSDLRWLTYPLVLLLVGWLAWWGFERADRLLARGGLSLPGIGDGARSGTPLALPEANVPAAPAAPVTPAATSALPLPAAPEPPTVAATPAGALSVGDGSATAVAIPAEPG